MRRILSVRPAHDLPGALVNNNCNVASQRGLDGSAVDLTVSLHGMRVVRLCRTARLY